jgi:hypothetical protein
VIWIAGAGSDEGKMKRKTKLLIYKILGSGQLVVGRYVEHSMKSMKQGKIFIQRKQGKQVVGKCSQGY